MPKFTVHLANEKTVTVEAKTYMILESGVLKFNSETFHGTYSFGKNAWAFVELEPESPKVEWDGDTQPANLLLKDS
jgi:hypothetical protein